MSVFHAMYVLKTGGDVTCIAFSLPFATQIYAINSENPGDLDMLCYKLLTFCLRAPEEILARLILMGISVGVVDCSL